MHSCERKGDGRRPCGQKHSNCREQIRPAEEPWPTWKGTAFLAHPQIPARHAPSLCKASPSDRGAGFPLPASALTFTAASTENGGAKLLSKAHRQQALSSIILFASAP